jgi:hypothetical protein
MGVKTWKPAGLTRLQNFRFSEFQWHMIGVKTCRADRAPEFQVFRFSEFQFLAPKSPSLEVLQHVILTSTFAPQGLWRAETGIKAMIGGLTMGLAGDAVKFWKTWNPENLPCPWISVKTSTHNYVESGTIIRKQLLVITKVDRRWRPVVNIESGKVLAAYGSSYFLRDLRCNSSVSCLPLNTLRIPDKHPPCVLVRQVKQSIDLFKRQN